MHYTRHNFVAGVPYDFVPINRDYSRIFLGMNCHGTCNGRSTGYIFGSNIHCTDNFKVGYIGTVESCRKVLSVLKMLLCKNIILALLD